MVDGRYLVMVRYISGKVLDTAAFHAAAPDGVEALWRSLRDTYPSAVFTAIFEGSGDELSLVRGWSRD